MNLRKYKLLWIALAGFAIQSCVPAKEFQALQDKHNECEADKELYYTENESLTKKNKEQSSEIRVLKGEIEQLVKDSTARAVELAKLRSENSRLEKLYADLQNIQEGFLEGTQKESRRVLAQLQATQQELQDKEDALKEMDCQLNLRRKNLEELQSYLGGLKDELDTRNQRIAEMEAVLARQDSAVMALRRKVSDALFGFEGKGLSVQLKNGKVYVSLDEQLMFKSGSHVVDANGARALRELVPVLEQNPDINILVEGHTDDVPFPQRGELMDNWDLSVKRATSIVRILLDKSKIDPARISASGRSQYQPIDSQKTAAARQKNRRTEIILTPKLDELFEILKAN